MTFGLQFMLNKNNSFYVEGFEYITLKSSFRPVIFGDIRRKRKSLFGRKYEYLLQMSFTDATTGKKFGGWYNTLEEAYAAAHKFLRIAFYDPRDYGPQLPEPVKE